MKIIKRIVVGILLLLVLLVAGVSYILFSTDFNAYKPQITEIVKEYTGRDLVINGDIKPTVSLFPTLEISDAHFSNVAWSKNKEMVSVGRFKIELDLMPLFHGNISIENVEIDDAVVVLEENAKGQNNWEFDTSEVSEETDDSPVTIPNLEEITVKNLKIIYIEGKEKQTFDIKSLELEKNDSEFINISLESFYNEQKIEVDGTITRIVNIIADEKAKFKNLTVKIQGLGEIKTDGTADQIFSDTPNVNLVFDMKSDGIYVKPYELSAKLANKKSVYNLTDVLFEAGNSNAKGQISADISKKTPFITANLQSDYLTLSDIIKDEEVLKDADGKEVKKAKPTAKKSNKVFSSEPLPFKALQDVNGKFNVGIKEFEFEKQAFSDIKINAVLKDGKLNISPMSFNVEDGSVTSEVFVDSKKTPPLVMLKTTTKKVNLGNLLENLDVDDDLKNGILNAQIDVNGRGNSVAGIMKNLYGNTTIFFEEGLYSVEKKLSTAMQAFVKVLMGGLRSSEKRGKISLNCSIANFEIKKGIVNAKTFVLDTNGAFVTAKGDVDLGREKLNILLSPTAKKLGVADLVSAMRVGGTLASPSVYPDPLAITKNVAKVGVGVFTGVGILGIAGMEVAEELGFSDDNPCADILKKQGKQQQKNQKSITDKIGGKTKKIGDKLKGLFDF